jgi:hypothetical protein
VSRGSVLAGDRPGEQIGIARLPSRVLACADRWTDRGRVLNRDARIPGVFRVTRIVGVREDFEPHFEYFGRNGRFPESPQWQGHPARLELEDDSVLPRRTPRDLFVGVEVEGQVPEIEHLDLGARRMLGVRVTGSAPSDDHPGDVGA